MIATVAGVQAHECCCRRVQWHGAAVNDEVCMMLAVGNADVSVVAGCGCTRACSNDIIAVGDWWEVGGRVRARVGV